MNNTKSLYQNGNIILNLRVYTGIINETIKAAKIEECDKAVVVLSFCLPFALTTS
jgi:hypothetical protein